MMLERKQGMPFGMRHLALVAAGIDGRGGPAAASAETAAEIAI